MIPHCTWLNLNCVCMVTILFSHSYNRWKIIIETTRTTRMPTFWGYPPPPHDYPYHWVILDPKSKEDTVKATNLKNSPKFQFLKILKQRLHAAHLLRLLNKICKHEMDPMNIVEDTEWTRFCPQTDRWTDGRTDGQSDKVKPEYPLFNFVEARGIIITETKSLSYWWIGHRWLPRRLSTWHPPVQPVMTNSWRWCHFCIFVSVIWKWLEIYQLIVALWCHKRT